MNDVCSDTKNNDVNLNLCAICDDYGADNELWYRCAICGLWAHSQCSRKDSPTAYICEHCVHVDR